MMRIIQSFALAVAASLPAGALAMDSVTIRPATQPTPAIRASTRPAATAPSTPISAILSAATPSAVVDAYSRAAAAEPGNLGLEKAYIHRMVELNVPEMADLQARNLVQRDGSDGMAWGVVAYMAAARGVPAAAIDNIKTALQQSPDDPFVLRTAGQIVAWYDAQKDHANLSKENQEDIAAIRAAGAGKPVYAAAYQDAQQMRRNNWPHPASTRPSTQPQSAATQPMYSTSAETGAEAAGPIEYSYTAPAYTNPYVYYPVYPVYPYIAGGYGWPGIIILNPRFDHHFHGRFFPPHELHEDHFHGGEFHDHQFHGNEFHGNEFHGGEFHGEFHGGEFHGNEFHGSHDGSFHHESAPSHAPMTSPRSEPDGSFNNTGHSFNPSPHGFGPQSGSSGGGGHSGGAHGGGGRR